MWRNTVKSKKPNNHVGKNLKRSKLENRVNEFVSKTMELVDKVIEASVQKMNGELEAKMTVLEKKLAQMNMVVIKDEEE
jgi:hypothetical protein